jgi:sugar phosphate isomerase/epimerase
MNFCISANIDQRISIKDWYQAIAQAGFSSLTLNRDFAHCSYEEHAGRLQLLAEASACGLSYSLLIVPTIADTDITCTHGETRMGAVCTIANAMHAARMLGCESVVLGITHALPNKFGSDTASAIRAMEDLVETAENMGINLLMKNLIDARSLETLEALLSEYPSRQLGICYSPALDLMSQQTPYRLLDTYPDRVLAMQLSDTDRRLKYDLPLFQGLVDWHRISAFLASRTGDIPLHLELLPTVSHSLPENLALWRSAATNFEGLASGLS